MLTLTRRELETKKKLELLEEFDPSILLKTRQFLNTEISKGIITQQDYDEFWPKESGSFSPVLVIENDLTKNLRLIRPQQVMFDQDTIQKSIGERKGYYMNTLRNRELDIVGMPWGYDIIKGRGAPIGEIRYYSGIPYQKVTSTGNPNKDWRRVKDIPKKPGAKGGEKHEGKVEEGNFKVTLNSGHDIREITIKEVDGQFLPVIHDIYKDDKSPVHSSELIYHKTKESAIKQAEEFADKLIKIGYKKEPTTPEKKYAPGSIHEYNGKKYKKQANGKWLEVSESHGWTKNEHEKEVINKLNWQNKVGAKHHENYASNLSDKEHTDEEVGLGKKESRGEVMSTITDGIDDLLNDKNISLSNTKKISEAIEGYYKGAGKFYDEVLKEDYSGWEKSDEDYHKEKSGDALRKTAEWIADQKMKKEFTSSTDKPTKIMSPKDIVQLFKNKEDWGDLGDYISVVDGKLQVIDSFYYGGDKKLSSLKNDWIKEDGSYAKYFKEEYGIKFKLTESDVQTFATGKYKKLFGKNMGMVLIKLEVENIQ